jgi:photosystem II stability/assembly factor-like uncharacterized protein
MRPAVVLAVLFVTTAASAQWEILPSGSTADLRGIDALGKGIAWASGSDGTVLRTTDDGKTWQPCAIPPDAEHLDFRGVQAFDAQTAIVMSTGKGALSRLYKTTDGCKIWTLLFTNPDPEGFWDALRFRTPSDGYVLGDPVGGQFSVGSPQDWKSSQDWRLLGDQYTQSTLVAPEGVHAFAASNSALALSQKDTHPDPKPEMWFGTSGPGGAFIYYYVDAYSPINPDDEIADWHKVTVPLAGSDASSGVFSVAFKADQIGVAVGGDSEKPDEASGTAAFSTDSGKTWELAQTLPHGFRSAVAYDEAAKTWITVGPNGTDISTDDGRNWRALRSNPALHEPADSDRDWNALSLPFVVGPHGRIGKLRPDALTPASAPKGAKP